MLKTIWDDEFHRPVVLYYDKAKAESAGVGREELLLDLEHPAVQFSSVEGVVKWINPPLTDSRV